MTSRYQTPPDEAAQRVLKTIRELSNLIGPVSVSDITAHSGLRRPDTTQALDRLESQGRITSTSRRRNVTLAAVPTRNRFGSSPKITLSASQAQAAAATAPHLGISGPPASGRTTAALARARSFTADAAPVLLICPNRIHQVLSDIRLRRELSARNIFTCTAAQASRFTANAAAQPQAVIFDDWDLPSYHVRRAALQPFRRHPHLTFTFSRLRPPFKAIPETRSLQEVHRVPAKFLEATHANHRGAEPLQTLRTSRRTDDPHFHYVRDPKQHAELVIRNVFEHPNHPHATAIVVPTPPHLRTIAEAARAARFPLTALRQRTPTSDTAGPIDQIEELVATTDDATPHLEATLLGTPQDFLPIQFHNVHLAFLEPANAPASTENQDDIVSLTATRALTRLHLYATSLLHANRETTAITPLSASFIEKR